MTREERLVFCQCCVERKMDWDRGLLCGLTNEHASFEGACPSYKLDEKLVEEEKEQFSELEASGLLDHEAVKTNAAYWLIGGILVTVFTFGFIDEIGVALFPFGAIIYGGYELHRGYELEKAVNARNEELEGKTPKSKWALLLTSLKYFALIPAKSNCPRTYSRTPSQILAFLVKSSEFFGSMYLVTDENAPYHVSFETVRDFEDAIVEDPTEELTTLSLY